MRALRIALLIGLLSAVAGCILPPAFTIVSFAADGFSLVTSGKTVTDQAISLLAHRDCRLWRVIQGKSICGADASVVAVAKLPPPLPLRAASPAFDPPAMVAAATPVEAPIPEPVASSASAAHAPMSAEPAHQENAIPTTQLTPASAPVATNAPTTASPRQKTGPATAMPTHQAASHSAVPVSVAALPARRGLTSDGGVRGEMVIRSGTDEAEARALAEALHAAGATVRPVRHGDITVYEVVMGLSG